MACPWYQPAVSMGLTDVPPSSMPWTGIPHVQLGAACEDILVILNHLPDSLLPVNVLHRFGRS